MNRAFFFTGLAWRPTIGICGLLVFCCSCLVVFTVHARRRTFTAGFDCDRAETDMENTICRDYQLAAPDVLNDWIKNLQSRIKESCSVVFHDAL